MSNWAYRADQELPSFAISWADRDGNLIDFTSGYTFELKLAVDNVTAPVLVKTTGITGAATAPNIVVAWASGDLNVAAGVYKVYLKATTGGNDRRFRPLDEPKITIKAAPAAAAP
jgi:hypothetical protein